MTASWWLGTNTYHRVLSDSTINNWIFLHVLYPHWSIHSSVQCRAPDNILWYSSFGDFFHICHTVICVFHSICIMAGNVQLMSAYMQCGIERNFLTQKQFCLLDYKRFVDFFYIIYSIKRTDLIGINENSVGQDLVVCQLVAMWYNYQLIPGHSRSRNAVQEIDK